MFRIKICGVTNVADARMIADAGADAVGLNFFAESPRSVDVETAREIAAALPPEVVKVGVFVNRSAVEVDDIAYRSGLDVVQLHSNEPVEFVELLAELSECNVIRAFRCRDEGLSEVARFVQDCQGSDCRLEAVLIDAYVPGQFGGTGEVVDWPSVARRDIGKTPAILAGGLTKDNVREAILTARPDGVDTASGVESSPGKKDPGLVRTFVREARAAFGHQHRDGPG